MVASKALLNRQFLRRSSFETHLRRLEKPAGASRRITTGKLTNQAVKFRNEFVSNEFGISFNLQHIVTYNLLPTTINRELFKSRLKSC